MLMGLLLPVSVYAAEQPPVDVTVEVVASVETETTTADSCAMVTEDASVETVAEEEAPTAVDSDGADEPDQCQDNEGTYSQVSWNS